MINGQQGIVVTGAAGLIGHEVIARLVADGHKVTGIYRSPPGAHGHRNAKVVVADLAVEGLDGCFSDMDIDVVVHCAAVLPSSQGGQGQEEIAAVNRKIDDGVISFCRERACRLIYMSGTAVYGFGQGMLDEEAPTMPVGAYVKEKVITEERILTAPLHAIILRVSAPYGPRQRSQTVLKTFIERALAGEDIYYYGTGSRTQDFTASEDVADAVCKSIERPDLRGCFNIAGGNPVSMKELAQLVIDSIPQGSSSQVLPAGVDDPQEGFRACYSIAKAERELAWWPRVALADGVREWLEFEMADAGK